MTSVLGHAYARHQKSQPVAIVWKRVHGHCDFFRIVDSLEEAEAVVKTDMVLSGLDRGHYEVKQG